MTEVRFSDYQRVFRLYTEAVAGRPLGIRPSQEAPTDLQIAGHDLPAWDGETVYLPRSVDELDSARANFSIYKVAILHQLGYDQLGTGRLKVRELRRRLDHAGHADRGALRGVGGDDGENDDLLRFFDSFPEPALARRLFNTLEDARIDAHLWRSYPGMRRRLEAVMQHCLGQRPALARLLPRSALEEGLLQYSLGAVEINAPASMGSTLHSLRGYCDEVRAPDADVYTTALATQRAYAALDSSGRTTSANPLRESAPNEAQTESKEVRATIAPSEEGSIDEPPPVPFRGRFQPEALIRTVLIEELVGEMERLERELGLTTTGVSAELGDSDVEITSVEDSEGLAGGMPATDLDVAPGQADQKPARQRLDDLRDQLARAQGTSQTRAEIYLYDEWDHTTNDYRRDWATLHQQQLDPEDPKLLLKSLDSENDLRRNVRRLFGQLKPELLQKIRRLEDGEEIDLDAAVEARVDRRTRNELSDRVYSRRQKKERDVAAAFLLDMSASTDSEIPDPPPEEPPIDPADKKKKIDYTGILGDDDDWSYFASPTLPEPKRKVIDVEKEAVLLMAEALSALGDAYGVYGFSGFGRDQVDFFVAKEPNEPYDESVRGRIAAMKPQRSTRMGPAIRHATASSSARRDGSRSSSSSATATRRTSTTGDDRYEPRSTACRTP